MAGAVVKGAKAQDGLEALVERLHSIIDGKPLAYGEVEFGSDPMPVRINPAFELTLLRDRLRYVVQGETTVMGIVSKVEQIIGSPPLSDVEQPAAEGTPRKSPALMADLLDVKIQLVNALKPYREVMPIYGLSRKERVERINEALKRISEA